MNWRRRIAITVWIVLECDTSSTSAMWEMFYTHLMVAYSIIVMPAFQFSIASLARTNVFHTIVYRCFVSFRRPLRCNHIVRAVDSMHVANARLERRIELVLDLIDSGFPSFWWDTSELGRCSFYLSLKFVAVVLYSSSHQAILFVWAKNLKLLSREQRDTTFTSLSFKSVLLSDSSPSILIELLIFFLLNWVILKKNFIAFCIKISISIETNKQFNKIVACLQVRC